MAKCVKILAFVLLSLAPLLLALTGMYLTWNSAVFPEIRVRGFIVLFTGILGYAFGVLLFWRLAESASIKRG
jgi:uncharacterized membrane protein